VPGFFLRSASCSPCSRAFQPLSLSGVTIYFKKSLSIPLFSREFTWTRIAGLSLAFSYSNFFLPPGALRSSTIFTALFFANGHPRAKSGPPLSFSSFFFSDRIGFDLSTEREPFCGNLPGDDPPRSAQRFRGPSPSPLPAACGLIPSPERFH